MVLNFKHSEKFVSRWIVDGLDVQALTAYLYFSVKVMDLESVEEKGWGDGETLRDV